MGTKRQRPERDLLSPDQEDIVAELEAAKGGVMVNARLVADMTGLSIQDAEVLLAQQIMVGGCQSLLELTDGGLNDSMPESVWEAVRLIVRWANEVDAR